jgi:ribosomal protein L29
MQDLSPLQIEHELRRLKSQLGQVRERLNSRAADYEKAAREYKRDYARAYMTARLDKPKYPSVEDCKMFAQSETSGEEALYKATEQLVLNERKAVDTLLMECDITRSLYSKAFKELEQS